MRSALKYFGSASVVLCAAACHAQSSYTLTVNARLNRLAISPLIYGVCYGTQAQMKDLNSPVNRMGGDNTTRYNWNINADNKGADWYFESIGETVATAGYRADAFIAGNKASNAQSMVTIPMLGWVAKLGSNRSILPSFSVAKYGAQTATDPYLPDAGNGISSAAGNPYITGNDPNDANVPANVAFQQPWISHLVSEWGTAVKGGLKYYLMDNEPSIWFSTHRDVHSVGPKMDEILDDILAYGNAVKNIDPTALIVGPEEWGWDGYFLSGYDQQYGAQYGWQYHPDEDAHGGMAYVPYLLSSIHAADVASRRRTLDVFSLHYYPQDGSFSDDVSPAAQSIRNQSTRSLWDPTYVDDSWINAVVDLIPLMKGWVASYYPGTQTAITEYSWGADANINGATAEADALGIFGTQGLGMATRWTCPDTSTPTYKAMKLYGNYDGNDDGFGDISISDTGNNDPDDLSSFAAIRSKDDCITIMVINKVATTANVNIGLTGFVGNGTSQAWGLTAANEIVRESDLIVKNNTLSATVSGQSITLFVLPPSTQPVVVPSVPTGVTEVPLDKQVDLHWSGSPGATSYVVLRSLSPTTGFVAVAKPDPASYVDTGLTDGTPYYYEIEATNPAGTSKPSAVIEATPEKPSTDPAQYNFETGSQGWSSSGGMITAVSTTVSEHFLGAQSLAVQINATGSDSETVSVSTPATPAGATVTFHVWLPLGCQLSSIQPYVLQGASGGWTWSGNWVAISGLTLGAWNTITVAVPSNAVTPLYTMGVQFTATGNWSGTCYIDSVGW